MNIKKAEGIEMTTSSIDESQRKAAKVVGFTYLFTMVTAVLAFYIRGQLIVYDNATETAQKIVTHELLYRLSIACDLITIAGVVALITALYVILRPINRNLAVFSAFLRALGVSIGVTALLNDFNVLRVLSGADYLRVFEVDRLHALARLSIGAHGAGTKVDFIFLGLGSTVFCYLWLKSKYIPRTLATLGIFGSFLLAFCSFASIIFPSLANISMICMTPLGIFEVTMGFWLLIKGLHPSGAAE